MDTQSHYPVLLPSFGELLLSIGIPSDRPFSLPHDPSSVARATWPTSHVRKTAQGCREKRKNVRGQVYSRSYRQATTISVLPHNVLLEIFYFYKENARAYPVWEWDLLVHVCRGWRQIVFASPLRLDLRILCTKRSPVRKNLGIWPALPIFIDFDYHSNRRHGNNTSSEDNIVTALEHVDRVCDIRLRATGSELERISTVMQEPFPVLTSLSIVSEDGNAAILPPEFLGGSAPLLVQIYLRGIPFPALPTLLLSTSDLVYLELWNIPPIGYISPEAIVVGLAALPRLGFFIIRFESASPRPDLIHPPPGTRTVLPSLTSFIFMGASEYLEDLVARIDAPQLNQINICFFNQLVDFRVAQLPLFFDRSVGPRLTQFRYAQVNFYRDQVSFHPYRLENDLSPDPPSANIWTGISCKGMDWQVLHIAQVLSHFLSTFPNVVHLKLEVQVEEGCQLEGTDDVEWPHLFHQFSAMQTLRVSHELAGRVALALEDIACETVAEALPSFDVIYLADQPASSVEKFIAASRLSDRPVTVVETEMEFDGKLES